MIRYITIVPIDNGFIIRLRDGYGDMTVFCPDEASCAVAVAGWMGKTVTCTIVPDEAVVN